jgi:hypothetical protein
MMLPPMLAEALGFMQRPIACPDEVKARIAALRVPADEVTGTRMSTNWRFGSSGSGSSGSSGPGSSGSSGPAASGFGSSSFGSSGSSYGHHGSSGGRTWGVGRGGGKRGSCSAGGLGRRPDRALAPRFGNKARQDVTTEERMMDRIRDKMNKFSAITYEATKTWLSQLLDSGETEFLTDFITLVFEKAAAEPTFCALYARLITELREGFPHLDSEVRRIFGEFMDIFVEAAEEPTVGSVEYQAYVALRERRRYRRGYAAFVGEVAKLKVLTVTDATQTCGVILDGLAKAKVVHDKNMLCEEYADCLTALVKSCGVLLKPVAAPLVERVKAAMDRTDSPSLTNKARFALMDVAEIL